MNAFELINPKSKIPQPQQITTVILTGGPCAGKTSLMEKFRNQVATIPNVKVFFVKEAATLLKQSGINFADAGGDETFQRLIINQQLIAEHNARITAEKFAANHKDYKVIILCDRGIMDGEAYFENKYQFTELLADFELTKKTVFRRYDMVLFMHSAAVGAEQFYTTKDGTPRDESPEQAASIDANTYNAWCEHNNFKSVDNSFEFYEKLDAAANYIFESAGIDIPQKIFERYLIKGHDFFDFMSDYIHSTSKEQIFFLTSKNKDNVCYLKIQRSDNGVRYTKREVRLGMVNNSDNTPLYTRVYQNESSITENEFLKELSKIHPSILPMNRNIFSFALNPSVRCEIEYYPTAKENMILRVYMDSNEDYTSVTTAFNIIKNVKSDLDYSTLELARTECEILKDTKD